MAEILFQLTEFAIRIWKVFTYIVLYSIRFPLQKYIIHRLRKAGIIVNGDQPHDMKVHDDRLYLRIAQDLSLGFGEAYMDGWWDSDRVDELMCRILKNGLYDELMYPWNRLIMYIQFELFNLQTSARAFQIGEQHYDQGEFEFWDLQFTCDSFAIYLEWFSCRRWDRQVTSAHFWCFTSIFNLPVFDVNDQAVTAAVTRYFLCTDWDVIVSFPLAIKLHILFPRFSTAQLFVKSSFYTQFTVLQQHIGLNGNRDST